MKRFVPLALVFAALAAPPNATGALFFLFDEPSVAPNSRATARADETPKSFQLRQRTKPFQRPIRIYLLTKEAAAHVRSRFDSRLNYVGSVVLGNNGRGLLTFSVPPLEQSGAKVDEDVQIVLFARAGYSSKLQASADAGKVRLVELSEVVAG